MPTGSEFLKAAQKYEGAPYFWGGKGPDRFDCSGLIYQAAKDVGVSFEGNTATQNSKLIPITIQEALTTPGAILYRAGHSGVAIGDGDDTIEARNEEFGVSTMSARHGKFTHAGLIPGIDYSGGTVMAWSSPVPVGTRSGSNFGPRNGILHAGDDYPPKERGQQGVDIFAIGDGVVIGTGAGLLSGHSGKHNVLIQHPGNIFSYYGHLNSESVSVGQRVKGGQYLGEMGYSGNTIPAGPDGTHLHLGIIVGGKFVDPSVFLRGKGITVGSTPPLKSSSTPAPAPSTEKQRNLNIQNAMKDLGYYKGAVDGVNGPLQKAAVKAFQRSQGLVQDGFYGPKTQAAWKALKDKKPSNSGTPTTYKSVHRGSKASGTIKIVQAQLKKHGYSKQIVDGIFGTQTFVNVKDFQRRKGLVADGVAGKLTQRALGI